MQSELRSLPSIERLLQHPDMAQLADRFSREAVVDLARGELERLRVEIRAGRSAPALDDIVAQIRRRAERAWSPWPDRVVNATGVVLHTNLGRAPLSQAAREAIARAGASYADLEFELTTGKRGSRHSHISSLLSQITGAEAGLVVNNNASAVFLTLSALCSGREVIVSRGEAVEIGGGFRIPDVLRQSGAHLVEVGTTNKTYVADYESALTDRTAAFLKVHSSNFRISGFTHEPDLAELVKLAHERGLPVLNDLGSGCLMDTKRFGLPTEPRVQDSAAAGVDVSMFSGDKLLGGPQAGIIVGREEIVRRLRQHPLARALRVEKLILSGLSATLLSYLKGKASEEVPVWRMISATPQELRQRAEGWRRRMALPAERACLIDSTSTIGGGSLPDATLPTTVLVLWGPKGAEHLLGGLRRHSPPVIGRIDSEAVLLDPRTVLPEEDSSVEAAMRAACEC